MSYAAEQGVLNAQWNAAQEAYITEQARRAPHVLMRPRIFPDGTAWCALLGDDLQTGVAGFGTTPEAAAADFDIAWRTAKAPRTAGVAPDAITEGGAHDGRVTTHQGPLTPDVSAAPAPAGVHVAMATEYQDWIDFHAAGNGSFDDFMRLRYPTAGVSPSADQPLSTQPPTTRKEK